MIVHYIKRKEKMQTKQQKISANRFRLRQSVFFA